MKLYLILPIVAVSALAALPAEALARPGGGYGASWSGGGHGGGYSSGAAVGARGARISGAARAIAPVGARSFSGGAAASRNGAANISNSHNHHHHHHGHHNHHHGHSGWGNVVRVPATYPQNFANYGFQANYNTPYYVGGGFRQNSSPFGFTPSFHSGNPYANFAPYTSYGYAPYNRVFSYSAGGQFRGYSLPTSGYPAYAGTTYSPYYQGTAFPGYRPYGVYGPNGAYTVPAGGVGMAAVQSQLLNQGFYRGPVDGFGGPLTRAAIQRYQYTWGLPVTGRLDGALIQSMRQNSLIFSR